MSTQTLSAHLGGGFLAWLEKPKTGSRVLGSKASG